VYFVNRKLKMKKFFSKSLVAVSALMVGVAALAQTTPAAGPDLSSLTSSVSVSTTVTAILAIGATLAVLFIAIRGAKVVLSMIRGG
jgi:hypothetical protein